MSMSIRGLGRFVLFLALGSAGARLWAQPQLTTIRDTVYRADGQPFNGIALVEWKSFQAPNNTNIGTQGTTVNIVNGSLSVRLAPTTSTANAYYLVRYNSDGQFQFSEIWSVPAAAAALRLRDVRATLLPGGILVGGGSAGGVVGETGAILPNFSDSETPSGAADGSNAVFTLSAAPSPASSLALFRNGLLQSAGNDYTLNGTTITFYSWAIPQFGDILDAFYRTAGNSATNPHTLLSTLHSDTTPSTVARGGLIVGQGPGTGTGTPTWAQLPIGQAGRCLTSTGTDAVWGNCLFTGLTPGSLPFVDANGSLAQNASSLVYNNLQRKLSVGNNTVRGTLHVFDSSTNAATELVVRAGSGQVATPMQTWVSSSGSPLAFVNADGGFNVPRMIVNTSSIRPGIRDVGTSTDPANTALVDGDTWYNTASKVRKTYESAQIHATPQIVCSTTGTANGTTAFVDLGTCTLPTGLFTAGDRLQIEATYMHSGGTAASELDVLMGTVTLAGRAIPAADDVVTLEISVGFGTDTAAWSARTVGVNSGPRYTVGQSPFVSGGSLGQLRLRARELTSGTDTVRLLNYTVRRLPQQINP
ncbi:MAG: hypothetical protein K2X03_15155 [Bryobacteraceae bacterium]|nr:hypothetical protein [Bryobacteraceae bacterium]